DLRDDRGRGDPRNLRGIRHPGQRRDLLHDAALAVSVVADDRMLGARHQRGHRRRPQRAGGRALVRPRRTRTDAQAQASRWPVCRASFRDRAPSDRRLAAWRKDRARIAGNDTRPGRLTEGVPARMTDTGMNFQARAPKIPPRILCIGMPVRDLAFRTPGIPARGSKENATGFAEICGGNALNAAISIVRLGGRAALCGPMGDARETSARFIHEQMANEGIDTKHLIHMPGLVTPISAVMIDPTGERTIVTFRDPELWKVKLPKADTLLDDCHAILVESRCAGFCTDICA